MIKWNRVSFHKNSRPLLQDISVELPAGQLTVILGPNGAGKSTFLRLCSKELLPSHGSIELHDRNLKTWSSEDLALFRGVLSQSLPMSFPIEVGELVLMGRYPHKKRQAMDQRPWPHVMCSICRNAARNFFRAVKCKGPRQQGYWHKSGTSMMCIPACCSWMNQPRALTPRISIFVF